ncbi:Outer membrane protein [Collimonas arenae]|uniref:Outer membrane protein n=1 Tax=Collimonas arenae TaxID=279058 RepID=A0A0A1F9E1_9BURK|nr:porin [Collimonas arenae]AIY41146.1 Outer membrane protein [Collimonas arenae]
MKVLLSLIGSSCALAFSPLVQAQTEASAAEKKIVSQSAVTFYGVLDAGVTFVNNEAGHGNAKLDTGVMEPNRWGVKGVENLGGGLSALFQLESSFNLDDGSLSSQGTLFDRVAMVGLSNQFGQLTFGTQYDLINDYVTPFNISASSSGYASHQGDFDRIAGNAIQRSVKFASADFKGLTFGALYAFADKSQHPDENNAEGAGSGNAWNIGAHYANGPFSAGASYMRLNTPRGTQAIGPYQSLGLTHFLGQPTFTIDPSSGDRIPINNMAIDSQKIFAIGAAYEMGDLTAMANFADIEFRGFGQASDLRLIEIGGRYRLSAALDGTVGYQRMHFEDTKANQLSLGLDYHLSKRSDLYVSADYRRASRGVNGVIGNSFAPSSNSAQGLLRVGMRHVF